MTNHNHDFPLFWKHLLGWRKGYWEDTVNYCWLPGTVSSLTICFMAEDFLEKLVPCKLRTWLFQTALVLWGIPRRTTILCSLSVKKGRKKERKKVKFLLFIFFFLKNSSVQLPASSARSAAAHVNSLMWAWPKVCRHERRYPAQHTVTSCSDNNYQFNKVKTAQQQERESRFLQ